MERLEIGRRRRAPVGVDEDDRLTGALLRHSVDAVVAPDICRRVAVNRCCRSLAAECRARLDGLWPTGRLERERPGLGGRNCSRAADGEREDDKARNSQHCSPV